MCGIVGAFGPPGTQAPWLERGAAALHHRGPDGSGIWGEISHGIALGQRRLAIQDLSPAGAQPMESADGRYHIVYNGEIYNHLELRNKLPFANWRGHSDTETLLACVSAWGVEKTLREAIGMFAFALYDLGDRRLILARDRFGEKPLYFGFAGRSLIFGSELRALQCAPDFDRSIDRIALALFLRKSCVPGSLSIFSGTRKLAPGSWVEVDQQNISSRTLPEARMYWSALQAATQTASYPLDCTDDDALAELEVLLRNAVKGQMLSDVPLGAFLSGGIDSSTIVALMQAQSSEPVRTFSIGFAEETHDESPFARGVAEHLGTHHTEFKVTAADALALVPELSHIYDEPFADSSQLPTVLVSRLARRHVTVALSGDAGDELFCGYPHYFLAPRMWSTIGRVPHGLRTMAASCIRRLPTGALNRLGEFAAPVVPKLFRNVKAGDRLQKSADLLSCDTLEHLYHRLVSYWWDESPVRGAPELAREFGASWPVGFESVREMMALDTVTYLPDDILVKVDRAAMSASLEVRVPLLDVRVFEFAWRLPTRMLVREGRGKWLLRQLLHRYVPASLVDRPKMGFSVPLAAWLRGPLRDWAEDLLSEGRIREQGYFDLENIRRHWTEHVKGVRNWQHELWNVLMFQAWLLANP